MHKFKCSLIQSLTPNQNKSRILYLESHATLYDILCFNKNNSILATQSSQETYKQFIKS
jgi:hypothetical protein